MVDAQELHAMTTSTESASESPWISIRDHKVRLERPDVIVFKAQGDITVDDVDEFIRIVTRWPTPENGFFYISDLTHLGHQTQQAAARIRALPKNFIQATAVLGASFRTRVLVDIMVRSARFLGLGVVQTLPQTMESYEEAHALFDKYRRGELKPGLSR